MPPPYDSVVSIGGQSFVDGIWRIFGPALQGLTDPLPIALPGFANAQMRVTELTPVFPVMPPAPGALIVSAGVEITGEALLKVVVGANAATIELGSQPLDLDFTELAAAIDVPTLTGRLTNLTIGTTLTGGAGDVSLPTSPTTLNLSAGTGSGTVTVPSTLDLPAIPIPAVVPVAVNLTSSGPITLRARLALAVEAPSAATRPGLRFTISSVSMSSVTGTISNTALRTTLQTAVNQIVDRLGLPDDGQPQVTETAVMALADPVIAIVSQAFSTALTGLAAETGRLVYPAPGAGASCDVRVLPQMADVQLAPAADAYLLQIGFNRPTTTMTDITTALPIPVPAGTEVRVTIGNTFALGLLCCLVERLPRFSLPVASTAGTTDVAGVTHTACCNFTGVTADFAGVSIGGGGLSVCLDGTTGMPKTVSLVGAFGQVIPLPVTVPMTGGVVALGTITSAVTFTLPLAFDLDDLASITKLRVLGTPTVAATVTSAITGTAIIALLVALLLPLGAGIIGFLLPLVAFTAGMLGVIAFVIVSLLVMTATAVASTLLGNATNTLLAGASSLRSPVAIPPGLLDAFGRLAPVSVAFDDLEADGVLQTPTSVWGLLPRMSLSRMRPPVDDLFPIDPTSDISVSPDRPQTDAGNDRVRGGEAER